MKYPDSRLLIFARAPEPGEVKTRLIPLLGAEATARLYAGLVHDCIAMAVTADLCPVELWCSPSPQHDFFRSCQRRYRVQLQRQAAGDLGQRMSCALQSTLQHSRHVVLIGTDCPALSANDIEAALDSLDDGAGIVLGPAADGGYYLIGMSTFLPFLFEDIPWSTSAVMAMTEARLCERGLNWHRLPVRRDLDTPDDYRAHKQVAD
jgi:rSAM/selenodomain-associated transferase 1